MSAPLKIQFLLPAVARAPVGGFKVVYEYANRLSQKGNTVSVVHLIGCDGRRGLFRHLVAQLKCQMFRIVGRRLIRRWFPLHDTVEVAYKAHPETFMSQSQDAIVATAWQTAEALAGAIPDGRRCFYLVQHLETWHGNEDRVLATWKTPLHKIVIARWLQEFGDSIGQTSFCIPNGLDFDRFYLENEIENRPGPSVMMLYHTATDKGSSDGLAALAIVREELPELTAVLFGVTRRPQGLPEWIRYYQRPDQITLRGLYNSVQTFIAPSRTEGWGLPPSEAMMCGAALAATDVGGHREFARHEINALLSPAEDPQSLAANIVRLLTDQTLRHRLARRASESIKEFTWDRAVDGMEEHLGRVTKRDA